MEALDDLVDPAAGAEAAGLLLLGAAAAGGADPVAGGALVWAKAGTARPRPRTAAEVASNLRMIELPILVARYGQLMKHLGTLIGHRHHD